MTTPPPILKAHWEAWDACNLHCGFCYRTTKSPLATAEAERMISSLAAAEIGQIVFAGGDPSLRPDIGALIGLARRLGMKVEVQTNAHLFARVFAPVLPHVDLFGFSLDAGDAATHDALRGTRDNFRRVVEAMDMCDTAGRPYVVRTVCSARNADALCDVGRLLVGRGSLRKWSVVQFSAIGEGYRNRGSYELSETAFRQVVADVGLRLPSIPLGSYANAEKGGVYFLIKPNGDAYTTTTDFAGEEYGSVGNVLSDGVEACLAQLEIDATAHQRRYRTLI